MWFPLLCFLRACSMNLTWRDMQHLVVRTSQPGHLSAIDWKTNGVGRRGRGWLTQSSDGVTVCRVLFVPPSWTHLAQRSTICEHVNHIWESSNSILHMETYLHTDCYAHRSTIITSAPCTPKPLESCSLNSRARCTLCSASLTPGYSL